MTKTPEPTNADIFSKLGGIEKDVNSIHEQVKKTNGRVTALEKREEARKIIEEYVKDNGIKSPKEEKDGWTSREKTLVAIIMLFTSVIVYLASSGKLSP